MVNESSTPYETAERLQSEGLYVFPLEDGGKRPRRGLKWTSQATLDARSLTQWAQKHPAANYAIATGPSGLVVLDEDKPGEPTITSPKTRQPLLDAHNERAKRATK